MIFPFSSPELGIEWMRWQAALTFKPMGMLSLGKGAKIGMAVPPKILALPPQHPNIGLDVQDDHIWLSLAGQRHLVQTNDHLSVPNWHPDKSSTEWKQHAQSMLWLVHALGKPSWPQAAALFGAWCRQVSRLSSSQLRAQAFVPDVVGQRLVALLQVLSRLPQDHDIQLYHWLRKQVNTDARFLARSGYAGLSGWSRLSVLEGQCVFAGSFDGLQAQQTRLLPELVNEATSQWDGSGAHFSADVAVSLASLVSLQNAYHGLETLDKPTQRQREQLLFLRGRLAGAAAVLRRLLPKGDASTNKRLPHFSGYVLPSAAVLRSVLDTIDGGQIFKVAPSTDAHLPWASASAVGDLSGPSAGPVLQQATSIYVSGAPNVKTKARGQGAANHAGLGALEVHTEAGPLLGGCGMHEDIGRWSSTLRSSAAFSMLQIEGRDPTAIAGQAVSGTAKTTYDLMADLSEHKVANSHVVEFSHDGFSTKEQRIHSYRRIRLADDANRIDGEERLDIQATEQGNMPDAAVLRFQLALGVNVRPTSPTRLELTQTDDFAGTVVWEFVLTKGRFAIEEGMWIQSDGTSHHAPNLAIHTPIRDGLCLVFWRLVRLNPYENGAVE